MGIVSCSDLIGLGFCKGVPGGVFPGVGSSETVVPLLLRLEGGVFPGVDIVT